MRAEPENALGAPQAALPRRALAGSAVGKALEALTLAGLVLLVPRALGPADYGAFAVALAVATGIATATGIGGPALFARVLGPLDAGERRAQGRALVRRLGAVRAAAVAALVAIGAVATALAPGTVGALQIVLVLAAIGLGTTATLLSQLALGLQRTATWSLRYPLENGVIVLGALVLYPIAGIDGALAAIALGAGAALALGAATAGRAIVGDRSTHRLPAGMLRFARLQAAGGALTQAVHRGAAPACALLGVGAAATGHAAIAAGAALAISPSVTRPRRRWNRRGPRGPLPIARRRRLRGWGARARRAQGERRLVQLRGPGGDGHRPVQECGRLVPGLQRPVRHGAARGHLAPAAGGPITQNGCGPRCGCRLM